MIENVRFTGHRNDVASLLAGLDIVVNASLSEGASHAIVEALLMRKGVAATDVGGTRDIVLHGETGLLVPPADPPVLANAIAVLLADQSQREEMGRQGRDHCLRLFDVKATVAGIDARYRAALREAERAGRHHMKAGRV